MEITMRSNVGTLSSNLLSVDTVDDFELSRDAADGLADGLGILGCCNTVTHRHVVHSQIDSHKQLYMHSEDALLH